MKDDLEELIMDQKHKIGYPGRQGGGCHSCLKENDFSIEMTDLEILKNKYQDLGQSWQMGYQLVEGLSIMQRLSKLVALIASLFNC